MSATSKKKLQRVLNVYVVVATTLFTVWAAVTVPKVIVLTWHHIVSWTCAMWHMIPLA